MSLPVAGCGSRSSVTDSGNGGGNGNGEEVVVSCVLNCCTLPSCEVVFPNLGTLGLARMTGSAHLEYVAGTATLANRMEAVGWLTVRAYQGSRRRESVRLELGTE